MVANFKGDKAPRMRGATGQRLERCKGMLAVQFGEKVSADRALNVLLDTWAKQMGVEL